MRIVTKLEISNYLSGVLMKKLLLIVFTVFFLFSSCQKDEDPTTWKNQIPIIESVTANPDTILVNGETTLICTATDPDGDSLTIEWKAKAGLFPIINTGKSVKWKAPDSVGIYPITAFVTDGKDTESDTVYVTVVKTPQPILKTPSDNAVDVSIPATLEWEAINGVIGYNLQVSTDSLFSTLIFNQGELVDNSQQIEGLNYLTKYYWRVRATNSYGTSNWSTVWSFTTTGTAPAVPTLSTPANNATGQAVNPTLTWSTSSGATSYTLQVSTNSSFTSFVYNQSGLTNPSQQLSGLSYLTQYYWRVSATNSYGTSNFSSVWNFTTLNQAGGQPCPSIPTVTYAGKTYNTVLIGTQCWLKENLNVGTRINGSNNQTNNSIIEKYCYNDQESNCDTYGGLYQWNEAMQYITAAGTKGICPTGWHIPTYAELQTLASAVGNNSNALKAVGQGSGSGAGTNTSGFSALLVGKRDYGGSFYDLGINADFWSSSESTTAVVNELGLYDSDSGIYFNYSMTDNGFSIRCIKD